MRVRNALLALAAVAAAGCAIPRWPVEAPITSPYGLRFRGIRPDIHPGVDLAAPEGTPVRAMTHGVVRFAGTQTGYGRVIWLDHGSGVVSLYAHLSRLEVETGARVRAGQTIGASGSTGDVTAPHLHFEILRWGRPVDPVPLLGGRPGG